MSWVYVSPAGVAVDIFIPEASESVDAVLTDWAGTEDGGSQEQPFCWGDSESHAASGTDVPPTKQQSPAAPTKQQPPAGAVVKDVVSEEITGLETLAFLARELRQPPQETAEEVMSRLYRTAPEPEQEATLAGISVKGRWARADALGPAEYEVMMGVLEERPPRQVAIRESGTVGRTVRRVSRRTTSCCRTARCGTEAGVARVGASAVRSQLASKFRRLVSALRSSGPRPGISVPARTARTGRTPGCRHGIPRQARPAPRYRRRELCRPGSGRRCRT
ncbi:hypothetical protein QFZ71_003244 [Streptomyces sp. V2I9]|nr:hypothetical protein [Streptomyces sp. V2I9]